MTRIAGLYLLAVSVVACAQPTVEEIRDQAEADLFSMMRSTAMALDQSSNRQAIDGALTRLSQLFGANPPVDTFGSVSLVAEVETLIADMERELPGVFSEENVVADIDDGKRFRATAAVFCRMVTAEASDCDEPDLETITFDLDVTVHGSRVAVYAMLTGRAPFASVSFQSKHIALEVMGKEVIDTINAVADKVGGERLAVDKIAGTVTLDWQQNSSGHITVVAAAKGAEFSTSWMSHDWSTNAEVLRTLSLSAKRVDATAALRGTKVDATASMDGLRVHVPADLHEDFTIEADGISAKVTSHPDGVFEVEASSPNTLALARNGKNGVNVVLDPPQGAIAVKLEPHGQDRTRITIDQPAQARVELKMEAFDETPFVETWTACDFGAGASALIVGETVKMLDGQVTLTSGAATFQAKKDMCVLFGDTANHQTLLDHIGTGPCN